MPNPPHHLPREELYALVWETPMSRLAERFGISGNGLAKLCDRFEVPYPPRGHWAKKQAGKPVSVSPLPRPSGNLPRVATIRPSPPRPEPAAALPPPAPVPIPPISIPAQLDRLDARVQAWVTNHKREQARREKANRLPRQSWDWASLLPDLTERDSYRLRITSAFLKAAEHLGIRIEDIKASGRMTLTVKGHKLDCILTEKMRKGFGKADGWTAWPDHHNSALHPTGRLRYTIRTWITSGETEWVEGADTPMASLLPDILQAIVGAGAILTRQQQEREAEARRQEQRRAEQEERRRQREQEQRQWAAFREATQRWDEHERLCAFLAELRERLTAEGDREVSGRLLSEWISWTEQRAAELDPLAHQLEGFFQSISRVS